MNDVSKVYSNKDGARLVASYLFSLSLFALAGSIVYFTYQIAIVSKQIPDILLSIDNTSDKVEPIIEEVGQIIDLVPPILKEVEETRKLIPPILEQVEQTRKQIPAVLKESAAIRGELPALLASANKASAAVSDVAKQVEATRPLIPQVLKEVETTREAIPPMMDRADVLIEKARVAGKEASEGAVTGLFTGIIRAPFALMGDAGRSISGMTDEEAKDFSDKDFSLNQTASLYLLNNGSKGEERKWSNAESGNHAVLLLTDIYSKGEYSDIKCRTLNIKVYKKDQLFKQAPRSFCKNDEGEWEIDEE